MKFAHLQNTTYSDKSVMRLKVRTYFAQPSIVCVWVSVYALVCVLAEVRVLLMMTSNCRFTWGVAMKLNFCRYFLLPSSIHLGILAFCFAHPFGVFRRKAPRSHDA